MMRFTALLCALAALVYGVLCVDVEQLAFLLALLALVFAVLSLRSRESWISREWRKALDRERGDDGVLFSGARDEL